MAITQNYKIGDRVRLTNDAIDGYELSYTRGNVFIITHVAKNTKEHPGYDNATNDALYDVEHAHTRCSVGNSFYDYELELVARDTETTFKRIESLSNAVGRPVTYQEHDTVHRATKLGLQSEVIISADKINRTIAKIHNAREWLHTKDLTEKEVDSMLVELLNSLSS